MAAANNVTGLTHVNCLLTPRWAFLTLLALERYTCNMSGAALREGVVARKSCAGLLRLYVSRVAVGAGVVSLGVVVVFQICQLLATCGACTSVAKEFALADWFLYSSCH